MTDSLGINRGMLMSDVLSGRPKLTEGVEAGVDLGSNHFMPRTTTHLYDILNIIVILKKS